MSKNVSQFAKIDPAFLADGLFRPRSNLKKNIDVNREFDGGRVRFLGPQLGAAHQSVLLALCARTGREGIHLVGSAGDLRGQQLKLGLTPEQQVIQSIVDDVDLQETSYSRVNVTAYSLLIDAGLHDNKKDYKRLIDMMAELGSMTVYRSVGRKGGISQLLSFRHDGEKMAISLNWRLADAIFGHQNIQVSLHERMALKSPTAKILHAWLSAHIRLGRSLMEGQGAMVDTLCKHVWGEEQKKVKRDTASKRRRLVKDALLEINALDGWVAEESGSKCFVTRPKALTVFDENVGTPGQTAELIHYDQLPEDEVDEDVLDDHPDLFGDEYDDFFKS